MTLFNWFSTALAVLAIVTVIATATPRIAEKICVTIGGFAAWISVTFTGCLIGAYAAKEKITGLAKSAYGVDFSISDGSERSFREIQHDSNEMLAHIAGAADSVVSAFFFGAVASVTLMALCAAGIWLSRETIRDAEQAATK